MKGTNDRDSERNYTDKNIRMKIKCARKWENGGSEEKECGKFTHFRGKTEVKP